MAKYIPLDALVAEIKRRIKAIPRGETDKRLKAVYGNEAFVLNDLLSSINTLEVKEIGVDLGDPKGDKSAKYIIDTKTLEVKEVDLEKEIQDHIRECLDVKFPTTDIELIKKDVAYTAKKFFELGMRVSNPITAQDRGTVEENNELTWEDMRELYIIFAEVDAEIELCKTDIKSETIGYYEEVLKRFKNLKK